MRTLEILRALSDREILETDVLINSQKRQSLISLYEAVKKYRKRSGVPSGEEMFKEAFKKTYTKEKNYLLRNELRLLNELFYDFLINKTFSAYLKKHKSTYNYWLARAFDERRMDAAFAADVDRFIAHAQGYIKPEDGAFLLDLKSLWLIKTQRKTPENLAQQKIAVDKWKEEHFRFLRYRLREIESRQAYIDSTMASLAGERDSRADDWTVPPQTFIDLSKTGEGDWYEQYLVLKKYSYQTRGAARIKVLGKMLKVEESESYASEYIAPAAQITTLNGLALEHILVGDFSKANVLLEEGMQRCRAFNLPILQATLQNYAANQINLGSYQKGIDFIMEHAERIQQGHQYVPIRMCYVYCHLFLGQADQALAAIPEGVQFTNHQQLMFRMVYLIVFILRQQLELAMNECHNIGRMIKANQGAYFERYEWINRQFSRYLNIVVRSNKNSKKELIKLKEEIAGGHPDVKQLIITEFSLRWLMLRLE